MIRSMTLAAALLSASLPAAAQVYRCTDAGGGTAYQGEPCDGQGEEMATPRLSVTPSQPAATQQSPATPSAHDRANAAADRVQQIRRENADPEQCAQARAELARAEAADPAGVDVSIFMARQSVLLYCEEV